MSNLFDALPAARHPAWLVTWCTYPAAEGVPPARDCLRWKCGNARTAQDCGECVFCGGTGNA